MTKYVFFDIDGTLWDEKMIVPESTKLAIKLLQEHGHKAFVCTGRAMGNVNDPQFDEIGFDGFIAACGNHVEMDGCILYERNMSYEDVKAIYDSSREHGLPIIYISGALEAGLNLGNGSGPLNHAFDLTGEFAKEAE